MPNSIIRSRPPLFLTEGSVLRIWAGGAGVANTDQDYFCFRILNVKKSIGILFGENYFDSDLYQRLSLRSILEAFSDFG